MTETEKAAARVVQRTEEFAKADEIVTQKFADLCREMNIANQAGVTLDWLAEITGWSKGHCGRLCQAERAKE